ncbi:MAG: hypothetical protein LBT38_02060 [Deltaproteobacteria bacterium]|jgi:hypothetical protein|nr:hypothetical protein [Deltaproteobacteria bacterium]
MTNKSNERLWAWPTISGSLTPPEPALYLTWPAWEDYRHKELGEIDDPLMTAFFLPEPPNFRLSVAQLVALSQEGQNPANFSLTQPFQDPETAFLGQRLAGQEPIAQKPWPLILVLGHLSWLHSRHTEQLVWESLALKAELLATLKGETLQENWLAEREPGANPSPANPSPAMAAAWLKLAEPYLKPSDRFWPAYGEEPEMMATAGFRRTETGFVRA